MNEIQDWVRMGYYTGAEIADIFTQELYEPGELDESEVKEAIKAASEELAADQASWPSRTDCDNLRDAFKKLNDDGIISLENAGYTQSDGYDDVIQTYHENGQTAQGYCFFHQQDLERAIKGRGLTLSFGSMNPKEEETQGPVIGQKILAVLQEFGFETKWNGTFQERIELPNIDWQKRRT